MWTAVLEWHYIGVAGRSDGVFLNASWRGIDAKRVVDLAQGRFGDGSLADMQRAAVTLAEGGGDALLHRQGLTQTGPGCHPGVRGKVSLPTCLIEFAPDRLHYLIGQHGDEQVPVGTRLFLVEHRP